MEQMLNEFRKARDHHPDKRYVVHVTLRAVSLRQVETYCAFLQHCCDAFRAAFPDNLEVCYLYHEPFVFATLFRILSRLLDRDTRRRLKLYSEISEEKETTTTTTTTTTSISST
jgi:hypothetical protein